MPKGKNGERKPYVTPKQFADMARLLRMGMTVTDVCLVVGVSKATFYKWVAVGKATPAPDPDNPPPLRAFADSVASGKASAKAYALGQVHVGMKKDWKAAAWLLGVSHPKEYGPKIKVTLETEFSAALERLEKVLPPEMYEKALVAIAGGDGEEEDGGAAPGDIGPHL